MQGNASLLNMHINLEYAKELSFFIYNSTVLCGICNFFTNFAAQKYIETQMEIRSINDLKTIDEDLACLFLRSDGAANLVSAIENGIKDWIGGHNKKYWEIVRFVCEREGVLGKFKRDGKVKLSRQDFALVLLKFCPDAVGREATMISLKTSMEHYEFATQLKKFDMLLSGHVVRHYVKEVEDLLGFIC